MNRTIRNRAAAVLAGLALAGGAGLAGATSAQAAPTALAGGVAMHNGYNPGLPEWYWRMEVRGIRAKAAFFCWLSQTHPTCRYHTARADHLEYHIRMARLGR